MSFKYQLVKHIGNVLWSAVVQPRPDLRNRTYSFVAIYCNKIALFYLGHIFFLKWNRASKVDIDVFNFMQF